MPSLKSQPSRARCGTYVYALVAAARSPGMARTPKGLVGTGRIRLLAVDPGAEGSAQARAPSGRRGARLHLWLVVADAPLERYGEAAITRGLADLDWVARAAIRHEAVVESFGAATVVLPMKLFTIFESDERALEDIGRERSRIRKLLPLVVGRQEWGVRVISSSRPVERPPTRPATTVRRHGTTGAAYLEQKRARRRAARDEATSARAVVRKLYANIAGESDAARRRTLSDVPVGDGQPVLEAAFLVERSRAGRFKRIVARSARELEARGFRVSLTGPWPPYSFLQD
jgi:hypothetical protein